ncbi:MAG: hypothetical protein HC817_04665 [Saprospiraceae bacterium]|nr:hypothetical protein [Saprospiraceae bacterium]
MTAAEFAQDCLFYMRPDGESVKASRLFLGKIHDESVVELTAKFHQKTEAVREIRFNKGVFDEILRGDTTSETPNLEAAYHVLMYDLVKIQVKKIRLAAGNTPFKKIIIDGGFVKMTFI